MVLKTPREVHLTRSASGRPQKVDKIKVDAQVGSGYAGYSDPADRVDS